MPNALSLPAGFFGAGSDPFTGTVYFAGVPAAPGKPPSNIGLHLTDFHGDSFFDVFFEIQPLPPGPDTLIQRPASNQIPPGGSDDVPIDLVALNLVSVVPIQVTCNGGQVSEPWKVKVLLPAPAGGNMALTRDGSTSQGTFLLTIPDVQFNLLFTSAFPSTAPPATLTVRDNLSGEGTFRTIPEPRAWLLVPSGLALLALRRRR